MKPQLVVQDFQGQHNGDPNGVRARLLRNGSWKKQRVIVIIPAGESIPSKVYLSHVNLIYPPNNGVIRVLAMGMEVGEAYSSAIEGLLAHPDIGQWEFVLSLEHDNMPPPDGVLKLIETLEEHQELSAVGGLYFTKGAGGCAQIWGDSRDPVPNFRPQVPQPETVQECCGLGMGFTLYRLKMFKDARLRRPWFKTVAGSEGVGTQDLYFWGDVRKYGYRCAVDTRVKVGHYSQEEDIVW